VYGAAKLAGECYTRAYFEAYGYPTTVVRPFNAYGPRSHHEGDCGEVIPKFLLRAMAGLPMIIFGDGTNSRDFTFVSDTAAGIIAAACSEQAIGQTLNLAQGVALSIEELAKVVAEVVGTSSQVIHDAPRPGDVLHLCGDANRARISLPWRPTVLIGEGLLQLKRWYEQQGVPPAKLLEQEIVRNWEVQAAHL
jgi:UDP-glucose 4-epimerase